MKTHGNREAGWGRVREYGFETPKRDLVGEMEKAIPMSNYIKAMKMSEHAFGDPYRWKKRKYVYFFARPHLSMTGIHTNICRYIYIYIYIFHM